MNVREHFQRPKTEGEVGIEVEVEGAELHLDEENDLWHAVHDGSLRGEAIEYVLRRPVHRSKVTHVLANLKRTWFNYNSTINTTNRAGVHVHINMQEEDMNTLGTFITLYYCFESVLLKFCGEDREGNLFCLRNKDAEGTLDTLLSALRMKNLRLLKTDILRYSSLNLKALGQYGSLEFRGMRSTSDLKEVKLWVDLLLCLKDAAKKYKTPSQIPYHLSAMGVNGFISDVFGKHASVLLKYDGVESLILEDMRATQEVAFSTDWAKLNDMVYKEQVFKYGEFMGGQLGAVAVEAVEAVVVAR